MIGLIDSGLGNINSVANMVRRAGGECTVVRDPARVDDHAKLILPGVGAFDRGMEALHERGFDTAVRAAADRGAWLFGVCLGMQLLLEGSEEGARPGLGLVPGQVKRLRVEDQGLKVPHMGWNVAHPTRDSLLFDAAAPQQRYYFVHSFYAAPAEAADITATASHGIEFACGVQRGKVLGVQFHPEKSHRFGLALMQRFVALR